MKTCKMLFSVETKRKLWKACLNNQSALFVWDASVDANGLPSYSPRRLGESKFRSVSAGRGFIAAITSKGVLVVARAPLFDIEIVESLLGIDCADCAAGEGSLYVLSVEGECWHVFDDIKAATVKQFRPRAITLPRPVKPVTLSAAVDAVRKVIEALTWLWITRDKKSVFHSI